MALANRVVAGGNVFEAWTVEDTGTVGIASTYLYKLADNIISTDVTRDAGSGAYSVKIEHVEDTPALQAFIEAATNQGSGAIEDLTLEDGVKETGAAQNKKLIVAVRGGYVGGTIGNARKIGVFPQRLSNDSGGWKQAGETYNRVTLGFEGFKLQTTITIAGSYFADFASAATPTPVTLFSTIPYGTVVYK